MHDTPEQGFVQKQDRERGDHQGAGGQAAQGDHADQPHGDGVQYLKRKWRPPEQLKCQYNEGPLEQTPVQVAVQVAQQPSPLEAQRQRGPGQKDECRRAQVGNPAGEKLGGGQFGPRLVRVPRIIRKPAPVKDDAGVVDGHEDHDETTHPVDGRQAAGVRGQRYL